MNLNKFDANFLSLDPNKDINPFLSVRLADSYSKDVERNVRLLTFYPNGNAIIFGSAAYRIQTQPGDIDLLEEFKDGHSLDACVSSFEENLKRVVTDILDSKLHYFSEFKAGTDDRYPQSDEIGELRNGIWTINPKLNSKVRKLYDDQLISENDFSIINSYLAPAFNFESNDYAYDVVFSLLREYRILRWTADEILNGKCTRKGKRFKLHNALKEKGHIKIDCLLLVNDQFLEMTNFVGLVYYDNGKLIPINVDLNEPDVIEKQLPVEIEKLYFSDFHYNPFKMVKRLWSLSRNRHKSLYIEKLSGIISSIISMLYKIKSEIGVIQLILERVDNPPMKTIHSQLDKMKNRLANVLQFSQEEIEIINELIDSLSSSTSKKYMLEGLSILEDDILIPVINNMTICSLEKVGLNPPNSYILPKVRKYKNVTRTCEF